MKQRIFIGSSGEGREVCDALMTQLTGEFEVEPWHISFPASHTGITALLDGFMKHNYGVFVMSADDHAKVRGKDVVLPRDNVLFEAGLFMGMHGLHHTFLVCPDGVNDFHLLSDVDGVTYLKYDFNASSPEIAAGPVVQKIKRAIKRANDEAPNVQIKVSDFKKSTVPNLTWPLKLHLKIKNTHSLPVTVHSKAFTFLKARQAANNYVLGGSTHNVAFKRWITPGGKNHDQYHEVVYLTQGEEVEAWVAFDDMLTDDEMAAMHAQKELGVWMYSTTWHGSVPKRYDHEIRF